MSRRAALSTLDGCAGRVVVAASLVCLLLGCLTQVAFGQSPTMDADSGAAAQKIRWIGVKESQLVGLIPRDYRPVRMDRLLAWIVETTKTDSAAMQRIDSLRLSARYEDGMLKDGLAIFRIATPTSVSTQIPLASWNLSVLGSRGLRVSADGVRADGVSADGGNVGSDEDLADAYRTDWVSDPDGKHTLLVQRDSESPTTG
ncbi:MAG: hypothetical protein AAF958_00650, partial [Planctomycetota bacterium]